MLSWTVGILIVICLIAFVHSGKRRQATPEERVAMKAAKKVAVRKALGR